MREEQIDQFFDVIKNKRDWAMFRLMLRCGLRVEEVANSSLDFSLGKVAISGDSFSTLMVFKIGIL
jgi:site-specific recombinase XerC